MRVTIGDGRLTLAAEPRASFRVLVLDAFSSDAVPIHLLTREALAMYLARLEPDGLLAFHISNRFVDLRPVLSGAKRPTAAADAPRAVAQVVERGRAAARDRQTTGGGATGSYQIWARSLSGMPE